MKSLWPWLCALLTGVLLALGFVPFDQGGLIWVALTPLVAAVWFGPRWTRREWLRGPLLGYLAGLVYFLVSFFWLSTVTRAGWA
ncbi:MAG TPA: hypothetical protein VIS74_07275, partial [Chthoniobacterales bacterium]